MSAAPEVPAHPLRLVLLPDAEAAAQRVAVELAAAIGSAVTARGTAHVAVSGGTTPTRMLAHLDRLDLPWDRVHVYQVDERVAPDGHPDRNLTVLQATMRHGHLHPIPVAGGTPEEVARSYATGLPARFDAVHLGLGADGHTASLVPGDPVLHVVDRTVAVTAAPYQGRRRVTLTYPALAAAHSIVWLVTGADKRAALRQLLDGDPSIPAAHVARTAATVVADVAATR